MNSTTTGVKKPGICRYFASTGTCFYGDDCQFLHHHPDQMQHLNGVTANPGSQLTEESDITEEIGTVVECAELTDYVSAISLSEANGLPAESKLKSYLPLPRSSAAAPVSYYQDSVKGFVKPAVAPSVSGSSSGLVTSFSNISITGKGTPVSGDNTQTTPPGMVHSSSTPSFSNFTATNSQAFQSSWGQAGLSPGNSPRTSPPHSPNAARKSKSPAPAKANRDFTPPPKLAQYQENVGGTTYFFTEEVQPVQKPSIVLPDYHVYPSPPAHVAQMKQKPNSPSFFMSDEIRMEILNKHTLVMAQVNPEQYPDIPTEVDNYHHLVPLEPPPVNPMEKSNTFGYTTSVYKATHMKTGLTYCLRRIHGFRLVNTKALQLVDFWKKLQHANIVQLREVFTTKAFGDHSLVFAHDYHPAAETLMYRHFSSHSHHMDGGKGFGGGGGGGGSSSSNRGLLPENVIWGYVVQLSSALRTIHAAGLACRVMDPTKILVTGKNRLRVNCVGIFDVLSLDATQPNPIAMMPQNQQEDLISLGKIVLALACNSVAAIQREHIHNSMEMVARNYSGDLKNLILYLLTNQPRLRSVNDIMPMIGARFYSQLDSALCKVDVLEAELAKVGQNKRDFRVFIRMMTAVHTHRYNMDPSWSETGDRYLLKLFRDYLFHQVREDGTPWIDMAHIVQCINKLDAGVPEKVQLMSRDEQNILVVSYADLKHCVETSYSELLHPVGAPHLNAQLPPPGPPPS
ncbi:PREDICTED: PAB-dependent poly(A)-specific ribonuclease subunit PAN3-like [Priapulus caudatus]|uniref:PAN2-PAN3 deadenylation complex subunit PAN3 n=1 Tax=Priapulus caudatus TaxID=37621 RepID=A0ABM1EH73_PRICU|nr:PREDICTED: PAB-dependent poly(A)-specific ribonuclease subunit PAN3-like [Priapulus caudatus]